MSAIDVDLQDLDRLLQRLLEQTAVLPRGRVRLPGEEDGGLGSGQSVAKSVSPESQAIVCGLGGVGPVRRVRREQLALFAANLHSGGGEDGLNGFQVIVVNDVRCHTGMPTCDAAHAALLGVLNALGTIYLDPTVTLSNSQKGNLGEFITYHIANSIYPASTHLRLAGNALNPLSRISGAGLDLVYVHFDPTTPANDLIYIQEVKTTGAADLDYFDALKGDFKKLFGPDPQLTLQSRIRYMQNILEFERDDPAASRRVAALAATNPATASRVRLIPTGISSVGAGTPSTKLDAIRSSIAAFGWPPANIEPWSIVMSDLENRMIRLSRGLP